MHVKLVQPQKPFQHWNFFFFFFRGEAVQQTPAGGMFSGQRRSSRSEARRRFVQAEVVRCLVLRSLGERRPRKLQSDLSPDGAATAVCPAGCTGRVGSLERSSPSALLKHLAHQLLTAHMPGMSGHHGTSAASLCCVCHCQARLPLCRPRLLHVSPAALLLFRELPWVTRVENDASCKWSRKVAIGTRQVATERNEACCSTSSSCGKRRDHAKATRESRLLADFHEKSPQ